MIKTLDEVIEYLTDELKKEDKVQDFLIQRHAMLHMKFGMAIRNHFKLWDENNPLLLDIREKMIADGNNPDTWWIKNYGHYEDYTPPYPLHADDASGYILRILREKLTQWIITKMNS